MSSEEILIAGHSHLSALAIPIKTPDGAPAWVELRSGTPPLIGLTGAWPRDEAFWRELERRAPLQTVALSWQGNQHVADFLFERSPPFDFVAASRPDLDVADGVPIVPEALVRAHFAPTIEPLRKTLAQLRQADQLVILGTPPPKSDNDRLRTLLGTELHFLAMAKKLKVEIATVTLTRPVLRLKLWTVIQDLLQDFAKTHNCRFIAVPETVKTAPGFLRDDLWREDVTHANRRYGKLMLDEIERQLCTRPSRPLPRKKEAVA